MLPQDNPFAFRTLSKDCLRVVLRRAFGVGFAGLITTASACAQNAQQAQPPVSPNGHAIVRFHQPDPINFDDHTGFIQIFDGKTLDHWDGDPSVWRVDNGAIVGQCEKPHNNSYISYRGETAKDFDLKLEIKVEEGGGSGIQYRSQVGLPWIRGARPGLPEPNLGWMMTGPQADFWYPVNVQHEQYSGQFYSENTYKGILAWRGQVTMSTGDHDNAHMVANIGDRDALGGYVKVNDWNQYEIIARGGTFLHIINGHLMAVYIDDDPKSSNNQTGLIGFEAEGDPTKISIRNVWLRKLN